MEQLNLLQGDSLANLSVSPGNKEAQKMTVTSGQRCSSLYHNSSPLGCLVKTLLESSTWNSKIALLTWNGRDTKSNRLLFQLAPSMPNIDETESGFWATPNTLDGMAPKTEKALKKEATETRPGRSKLSNLRDQVIHGKAMPKLWPTPQASDNRDRGCMEDPSIQRRIRLGKQVGLTTAVKITRQSGSLNPQWVEWLMGYPIDHTALKG